MKRNGIIDLTVVLFILIYGGISSLAFPEKSWRTDTNTTQTETCVETTEK